jgi:hypothetical protein
MAIPSSLHPALIILLLASASYAVSHGARLLMRREGWLKWTAGVVFGFVLFLVGRIALAGAAWLVFTLLFGGAPDPFILIGLVGLASTPLLLAFVNATPFFGPGVLRLLYVIALIRLTTLSSAMLRMDWLGSLGWWVSAWLLTALAGLSLSFLFRRARRLAWTGIFGPIHPSPADVMGMMPGMKDAVWEKTG